MPTLRPMPIRHLLPALLIAACGGCGNQIEPASDAVQQVALYHCGVQNLTYEGMSWEVENDPFDLTNAPDTFTGFGSLNRNGDLLTFTDRAGTTLTFTPYERDGEAVRQEQLSLRCDVRRPVRHPALGRTAAYGQRHGSSGATTTRRRQRLGPDRRGQLPRPSGIRRQRRRPSAGRTATRTLGRVATSRTSPAQMMNRSSNATGHCRSVSVKTMMAA